MPRPIRRPGARNELWVVGGITLVALALGLLRLGSAALDFDEAYTIGVVRVPFSETWTRVTNWDAVQAPYYLLMSGWYEIGEQEWVLRLPSVLFFVASIPAVYLLGRRLFDVRTSAVAAGLLALNGLALDWAQQARSYSMTLLLVTVISLLLVRAVEQPESTARAVVYAVAALVAVYAQFLVGLVVATHFLSLLVLRPRPWRLVRVAGAIVTLGVAPAVVWVLTLRSDPLSWIERPSMPVLFGMVNDVTGGGMIQFLVLGAAAAGGLYVGWRAWRDRPGSDEAWGHVMLALWLVLPIAVLLVSTYTVKPLIQPRYLITSVPAFTLVAAVGLVWLVERSRRLAPVVVVVALFAAGTGALEHYQDEPSSELRDAVEHVIAVADPDDSMVAVPGQTLVAVDYYQRRLPGLDVETLLPKAGDPPAGEQLWEVQRFSDVPKKDPEAWDPMPGYDLWRDEYYVLQDDLEISNDITVSRYLRRS